MVLYKRQRIPKGQSKMENSEKLATQGTQYEEKNTTQHVLDTIIGKQTQTTCVGHHYRQTNTTQHVLDTTIGKQTQHNMCWTPLSANKHKQHVLDTTIGKQTNKQTNKHKQRK